MKKSLYFLISINLILLSCKEKKEVVPNVETVVTTKILSKPISDKNNGGLFIPKGFGALVVVDSIGSSRHLAVNDNGDIK